MRNDDYLEVWGDTVSSRHLMYSIAIGVGFSTLVFLIGRWALAEAGVNSRMIGSYSLLIGLGGCVVAGIVCAKLFSPKRVLVEHSGSADAREGAMDAIEAEVGPIGDPDAFPPAVAQEVKMLGLYDDFKRRYERSRAANEEGQ